MESLCRWIRDKRKEGGTLASRRLRCNSFLMRPSSALASLTIACSTLFRSMKSSLASTLAWTGSHVVSHGSIPHDYAKKVYAGDPVLSFKRGGLLLLHRSH